MMVLSRRPFKGIDKLLFAVMVLIFLLGILTISSSTQAKQLTFRDSYVLKQLYWVGIGLIFTLFALGISYQKFIDVSYIIYGVNILLLVLVLIIGHVRLGAQRWFAIGSFAFQPSEFMKLSLILALANYVGQKKGVMDSFWNFLKAWAFLALPFVLVLAQPDLGTGLLLLPIFFSIMFVSGASIRYMAGAIAIGLAGMPFFWHMLHYYQRQRLLVFLDPNIDPLGAGYTIIQSKIAVGSGGLMGKGWMAGTQNQLNFLPERHTDFIFSVIGEEWGFFGSIALVLLYFLIVKRAFNIAQMTSDLYGKSIATGIGVMFAAQVVINIGMTIGLMPVVGIPLPLISYGGSSLLTTMIAIGLLANVGMRRSMF